MKAHECKVQVKGTKKDFIVSKSHFEDNKGHLEIVVKEVEESSGGKMETPVVKNKMANKTKTTK